MFLNQGIKMTKSFFEKVLLITAFSLLAVPTLSQAQAAENRFQFQKTDNGILRFDGETGSIDKCSEKDGTINCTLSNDDRAHYEQEIKSLKEKIATLEQNKQENKSNLPTKQDLDQAYGIMKYFFDKFHDDVNKDRSNPDYKDNSL